MYPAHKVEPLTWQVQPRGRLRLVALGGTRQLRVSRRRGSRCITGRLPRLCRGDGRLRGSLRILTALGRAGHIDVTEAAAAKV